MDDNIRTDNKAINALIETIQNNRIELPYEEVRKICLELDQYGEDYKNDRIRLFADYYLIESSIRSGENLKEKDFQEWMNQAAYYARLLNEPNYLISIKNIEGIYYTDEGDYVVAINCYRDAYQSTVDYQIPTLRNKLLTNIGIIYYIMEDYHTTLSYFREAKKHKVDEKDQANLYNRSVMKYYETICYIRTGQIEEAISVLEQFEEELEGKNHRSYFKTGIDLVVSLIFIEQGELEKAKTLLFMILNSEEQMENLQKYQLDSLLFIDLLFRVQCEPEKIEHVIYALEEDIMENTEILIKVKYLIRKLYYYDLIKDYSSYQETLRQFFEAKREETKDEGRRMFRVIQIRKDLKVVKERQYIQQNREYRNTSGVLQDQLTGLLNSRFLSIHMEDIVNESRIKNQILTVGIVDIDRFRALTARYGIEVGNHCLKAVADILDNLQENSVKVIRISGDKFLIIANDYQYTKLRAVSEFISKEMTKITPHLTVSQGWVAHIPETQMRSWDYIVMAERYLGQAKEQGPSNINIRW